MFLKLIKYENAEKIQKMKNVNNSGLMVKKVEIKIIEDIMLKAYIKTNNNKKIYSLKKCFNRTIRKSS